MNNMLFPIITHVDQVRQSIHNCKDFSETTKDGLVIFNYKFGKADTFPDPNDASLVHNDEKLRNDYLIRRECRGLICDAETGEVLSRAYHKFFNVNELDECDEHVIFNQLEKSNDSSNGYVLLEKLDGYFVTALLDRKDDRIEFASKTGINNKNAKLVYQFLQTNEKIHELYVTFCREWIERGFTPIFEFCNAKKKIVICHEETKLILTALRNRDTGTYIRYEDMVEAASDRVSVVHAWRLNSTNFSDMMEEIKGVQGSEGCVLRLDSGAMYKIKTLFYTNSNKGNSDLLAQEWQVWALILNQKIDDIKATAIKRALRNRITQFEIKIYHQLQMTADRIEQHYVQLPHKEQSQFETVLSDHEIPMIERPVYTDISQGKDAMKSLIGHVASHCTGTAKLNIIRPLAGDIHFYH